METENIGGIDVVVQAHDSQYTAAMRRAALLARDTGRQIEQGMRGINWQGLGNAADRYFTNMAGRMRLLGRDLRSFHGALGAAMGGMAGYVSGRQFVEAAGGFEQQMEIMGVVSGATASQMAAVRTQALALGQATARSANDIAGAQLELSKMGFSMQRILELTPAVTNLSIAADMPMQQAANTAGAIMRQFNLEASQMENVMDVMMRGANQSAADVGDFAGSLRYAGAMARAANMDLETTVALLEAASNAGMEGYMAGTSLRSLVGDFNTPTPMAAQMFRQFNINVRDSNGQLRDMIDLIEEVVTKVPRNLFGPPMFEVDSANLLNALSSVGGDSLRAMRVDLQVNQTGEAARTAEARMKGLKGAIETLSGAFETLMIKIGDSGFLKTATESIKAIGTWISGLSETGVKTLAFAGAIGVAVVALGPFLFALGSVLTILTSMQGILLAGAGAAAAAVIWNDLSAAIRGIKTGIDATNESFRTTTELLQGMAGASREAQAAMLQQAQASAIVARDQADALEAAAQAAERASPRSERSRREGDWGWNNVIRPLASGWDMAASPFTQSRAETATEARAAADAARARYDAMQASVNDAMIDYAMHDPAIVARQRANYQAATAALESARRQGGQGFDTEAWLRSNPEFAHALAQPAYEAMSQGGRPERLPPFQQRFMGFTPGQVIQAETTRLERLATAAQTSTRAMEDLSEALSLREQSRDQFSGNYTISEERALEIVRARAESQRRIDMAQVAHQTDLTLTSQTRLTDAANQGARAYERMQIAVQLMGQMPRMTLEEASAMADRLLRSNEQLDRAVSSMQRWSQTFEAIGDRVASAFEEAIANGGSLGDVLKSLARDMLALVLRAAVLQPMAESIGRGLRNIFSGSGGGKGGSGGGSNIFGSILNGLGSIFGGFFADGGQLAGGKWGIVGERGPELIRGGRHGATVVPLAANMNGGGGMAIDARSYIDAKGADPAAIARLEAAQRRRDAELPGRIRAEVGNMNARGRAWS